MKNRAVLQSRRARKWRVWGRGGSNPTVGAAAGTWDRPQGGEAAGRVELWVLMDRDLEAPGLKKGAESSVQSGPSAGEKVGGSGEDGEKGILGKMKTHFFWK